MSELWVPTFGPPQIDDNAVRVMLARLMDVGVTKLTNTELPSLQSDHEPFGEYLDRWGHELDCLSDEGIWPRHVLKRGAALALASYREVGYYQLIDEDAFGAGALLTAIYGVPETYITSLNEDTGLQTVVTAASDAPEFWHDEGGMAQVLAIGAGSARYYLQQAVAA